MPRNRQKLTFSHLIVYTDGAIRPERNCTGLGAVACDEDGRIRFLWSRRAPLMTCNEAEYAAAVMALEALRGIPVERITLYSDSQILIRQMQGKAATRSPGLRKARARLRRLLQENAPVTFRHLPRSHNRLADALANRAAEGLRPLHGGISDARG